MPKPASVPKLDEIVKGKALGKGENGATYAYGKGAIKLVKVNEKTERVLRREIEMHTKAQKVKLDGHPCVVPI